MKKLSTFLFTAAAFFITVQSCTSNKIVINREVETEYDGKMLLGYQVKDQLLKLPYSDWYNEEHDQYQLDTKTVVELKKEKLSSYNLLVVMGTWCPDSHRDIPRLFKILEATGFPDAQLSLLAVNRNYQAPGGEEGAFNIRRVPTVIVQKNGREVGRIVEHPATGYLERDLLEIIKTVRND